MFSSPRISFTFSAALSDRLTSGASPSSWACACAASAGAASFTSGSVPATDIGSPCMERDAGQYSRGPWSGHGKNSYATAEIGIRVPAQSRLGEGGQLLVLTEKTTMKE